MAAKSVLVDPGPSHSCEWTIITVLAPEILVGKAFCEWRSSRDISEQDQDKQKWQVLHEPIGVHLANMGYFVLDWGTEQPSVPVEDKPKPADPSQDTDQNSELKGPTVEDIIEEDSQEVEGSSEPKTTISDGFIKELDHQIAEIQNDDVLKLTASDTITYADSTRNSGH